ncbi:methylated-DNA--[protein]-cysteine S-methyltransferase [Pseudoneobacillus sp. C159]
MSKPIIYWSLLNFDKWKLYVAATEKGICFIGSLNHPFDEVVTWVKKHFPSGELVQDDEKLQPYLGELLEYFQGRRKEFHAPSDLRGTPFQQAVWQALCEIPYGGIQTYSDIANRIEKPSAVRAVGAAIGANPVLISVPCHRVIGKNGKLTGFRGGLDMKEMLLELEKAHEN